MLNVQLIGNLGLEPESTGSNGYKIRVAHTTRLASGEERTLWVNVYLGAEKSAVIPYLHKGARVYVTGSLSFRIYTDAAGIQKVGVNINANYLEVCNFVDQQKAEEVPY